MTGQEIRATLNQAGVIPSKQLGQNFLIDPNMARWIVSQLDLEPHDAVLEVGPGVGSLTEHLVGKVRRVILIEFDARLAAHLADRYKDDPGVEVHHADGARFDRRTLFKHRPLKFLGNLPYSCGGAILKNLLSLPQPFERAVIMLQKEVIDRLAASPGTKDYGALSLRTQVDWKVEPLRTVPPEAFHPRPKIDSSVAILTPRRDGRAAFDHRLFDELVRRGFAQRRKQLKKQLPPGTDWPAIASGLDVPLTTRAEELTLDQWLELTRACDPHPLKDLPQKSNEIFDVVDADDQVTGQATRSDVHAKGLLHRAVHVFVFSKRGDLLLQLRSRFKDAHPGVWDSSVSGHLDAGEAYETAALRELDEEMGITPADPPAEIARIAPSDATGREHVRLYTCPHTGSIRYPAAEVETATWFPTVELSAWIAARPDDFASGLHRMLEGLAEIPIDHPMKLLIPLLCTLFVACDKAPSQLDYEIVSKRPHDPECFTQGLEFSGGRLLESGGQYGESTVREVDPETGEVLRKRPIAKTMFAEGITVLNNELWVLSWKENTALVLDPETFKYLRRHQYQGEGWGLTNDGKFLIMSDGTSTIKFLDPKDFSLKRSIEVTDGNSGLSEINELELVAGQIYANIYRTGKIARIDPETGKVTAWLDLSALRNQLPQPNRAEAFNGIALDPATGHLLVTGKRWPLLFEIKVTEK